MRLGTNLLGSLIVGYLETTLVCVARADSEIVIAIRYLQAKGVSHSHLYLYREDGKVLRQLTNDNSGQDRNPIFSPDRETIVFTREKTEDTREFWSVDPHATHLKKLDTAPDWYASAKSSPYFGDEEEEAASPSPAPSAEQSASPSPMAVVQQAPHQAVTALDATVQAKDQPPQKITAPDGSGEIFWRKGKDKDDPLDWLMCFRDLKSGQETKIGSLRGFPSFEPLQIRQKKDQPTEKVLRSVASSIQIGVGVSGGGREHNHHADDKRRADEKLTRDEKRIGDHKLRAEDKLQTQEKPHADARWGGLRIKPADPEIAHDREAIDYHKKRKEMFERKLHARPGAGEKRLLERYIKEEEDTIKKYQADLAKRGG